MGTKKTIPQSPAATAPLTRGARTIVVVHPAYGSYTAEGVKDRLQAVQRAAKVWGAKTGTTLQWSKIARECEFCEALTVKGETAEEVQKDASVDGTG